MKAKTLVTLLLFFAATYAFGGSRTLRWSRLAVTANLDADGRLHVQERHSIVFNGEWNGGERSFRKSLENVLRLDRISRIDASGRGIPLHEDKSLTRVDDYAWADSTLRWRSRLPSDPPFQNREITYVIEYTDANILIPTGDAYVLDHNFGLPDLQWPIDAYSLDLSLAPIWRPLDPVPKHIARSNALRGENVTVTARLLHAGAAPPAAVNFGAAAPLRYALLALLLAGAAFFGWQFWSRERTLGRFEPLLDPASIDRRWLDEHVFKFLPEVVGAAWDDRTGAAEVAAVIARLVHEGKLSSRIERRGLFKSDGLVLTLLQRKDSFQGYEAALVKAFFIDGDTTSTERIKAHYKNKGFDPVSKIRQPLQQKVRQMAGRSGAPKVGWRLPLVLVVAGIVLMALSGGGGALNIVGALVAICVVVALYVAGLFGAIDYRRRLSNLALLAVEFFPAALLIAAVPALLLLQVARFRFNTFMLSGLVLVSLAAIQGIFNLAKSRDGGERLENRRQLAAARNYFVRELRSPKPELDDAWFPYLLAFALGANVDRWFRSFGGKSGIVSSSTSTFASSSESTSGSSSSSGSGWTGGGGAFGGAGASGSWAVAAGGLAAGVASLGSGGSGGGGGGSSGGGGGGGW